MTLPRLFIVIDESLLPILEKIQSQLGSVQGYIVMADGRTPETTLSPVYDYEELIQGASEGFEFPRLEEDDRLKSHLEERPEGRFNIRAKQGSPAPFVEIRAVDEQGREVPWDGKTMGELQVRGPWIIRGYYNDPRSEEAFQEGWFRTGNVVTIDPEGYIQLVDRTKDLEFLSGKFAKWWLPDDIVFVERLPKTSV